MTTINIRIENIDREELRLIIAALRDKRTQMLATQESERIRSLCERREIDLTVGKQAHRMATLIESLRGVYDTYPGIKVSLEVVPAVAP